MQSPLTSSNSYLMYGARLGSFAIFQVGDFGLSRIKRNTFVSGGVRGTLPWMAPELLDSGSTKVSEKVSNLKMK